MVKPPRVGDGALIGVMAPASPVRREFVDRGIAELTRLGFRVELAANLYERGRYTAGSWQQRRDDLITLWNHPDVEAVFCARGGYGSMQLLASLDPALFRDHPKVLLGASDVTALHGFVGACAGMVAFHGPMVAQKIARGGYDAQGLLRLIQSPEAAGTLSVGDGANLEMLHPGSGEGTLLGGCLSMVASLVGTRFMPPFDNAVLFLEDTLVKPYQIDRMLMQLKLAGCFDSIQGIVFGQMAHCDQHPDQGYTLQELLRDWTADLKVPVWFGFPSGHTVTEAMTLPLGIRARLDADGLHLLEGAVT
jgi:muramoyltetrapeptide carboxypeptidase